MVFVTPSSSVPRGPLFFSQYPASGLLLKREFRSFEESEEDGERVYVPVDPLIRNLTNFGVAESDGVGKKQGHETLVMRITVPPHSQSWGINIGPSKHSDFSEVLFHFNPRRRFVAMNNRENNIWGQQVMTRAQYLRSARKLYLVCLFAMQSRSCSLVLSPTCADKPVETRISW